MFFLLLISYPFAVFFGLRYFEPRVVSLLLVALIATRLLLVSAKSGKRASTPALASAALALAIFILVQVFNKEIFVKLYPFFMSMIMLTAFAYTLKKKPSMIERLAKLMPTPPPPEATPYLNKVTIVWCAFFLINGIISLYSAFFASTETWTLYNGFLSYMVMGVIFVGEFAIRHILIWTKPSA